MEWYLKAVRSWNVFQGRARRKEYWIFYLIATLISVGLLILQTFAKAANIRMLALLIAAVSLAYAIFIAIAHVSVAVRRLHDTDRSGGWLFFGLIPLIGTITILVFLASEGTRGENRFGTDPKTPAG